MQQASMALCRSKFAQGTHAFYDVGKTRVSVTCATYDRDEPTSTVGSVDRNNYIPNFLINDCVT
eukprot:2521224-Pyramimonas_sp.AAC.1